MKRIFLLGFIFFPVVNLVSQNITFDRNAYRAEDHIVKQQVVFKDPGASGKDLTWDFSMLQDINEEYNLNYFIPDSMHMDTICGMEHRTRYYYKQKNDSLWAIGFENATTELNFFQPELKMRFPFQYGDTLFSSFEGKGKYSQRIDLHVKGYTKVQVDALGELKLPDDESVKKALRVHTQRYYTETGSDSTEMMLDNYAWYANGIRYPVFESITTSLIKKTEKQGEQPKDTMIYQTSFYYPPEKQTSQIETEPIEPETENAIQDAESIFTNATMLPNPVTDNLLINYQLSRSAVIWFSIHNNIGVPVKQTSPQTQSEGYHDVTINMSGQITGTYSVYVHVDGIVLQRVVVKK